MDEELRQAIESVKEQQPVQVNLDWYQDTIKLPEIKEFIRANINSASRSFVAIGYYLKYVRDKQLYKEEGYTGVSDFAKAEFGISAAQASKFMSINDRFSKDGNSPVLIEQYKDFSSSKLSEMLYLTDEQLEQVTITTTVAEIREIKEPEKEVSFSTSKTEPETKSIFPKVCKWDGKSNCVAMCDTKAECCSECPDHGSCNCECGWQDERIPKPSGKCLHRPEFACTLQEASKLAIGDGVACNAKCCWRCPKHGSCGYECNSSAHRPEVSKFSIEEIVRYSVPHINIHEELKKLCAYNLPGSADKVMRLMLEQKGNGNFAGKWTFSEDGFTYTPSDTLQTKTISWDEYCEAFRKDNRFSIEYYISENNKADPVNNKPEIVDSEPEFVNDVDEPYKSCSNCNYDTMDPDEYFADHPGTKEFQCNSCNDKLNNWEPKVDKPDEEPEPVETVEADIIETVPEEPFIDQCETSGLKFSNWLKANGSSIADIVDVVLMSKKVPDEDNLYSQIKNGLISRLITKTEAYYSYLTSELGIEPERPKQIQPELPVLKNNDQRKDFIDAYETWPIWIDTKETGERYYRYDLTDKVAMVVKVSRKHLSRNYHETKEYEYSAEQYYLVGIKAEWHQTGVVFTEDESRTFYECQSNKSVLVDYLKYFQKKGA